MPGFIGSDNWSGWSVQQVVNKAENQRILSSGGQEELIVVNGITTNLTVGWGASATGSSPTPANASKIIVALYDITNQSVSMTGATLVNFMTCTCDVAGADQVYTFPTTNLVANKKYALSVGAFPTGNYNSGWIRRTASTTASRIGSLYGYDNPPNEWTDSASPTNSYAYSLKLDYIDSAVPTFDTISSDNSIVAGAVNDTYVGTNLGTDATNILVTASDGTTQQWSITGATATGGTISLATLGDLPYPINGNTLSAKIRNGTTDIATLASPLVIIAPSGYVALPVVDATTNKTDNESAFAGYGAVPVGSMSEMATTDNLGNTVSYEMSSGNWTGRVFYTNYNAQGGEIVSGRFRSGSSKVWETVQLTVASPEESSSDGQVEFVANSFSPAVFSPINNVFSNYIN